MCASERERERVCVCGVRTFRTEIGVCCVSVCLRVCLCVCVCVCVCARACVADAYVHA